MLSMEPHFAFFFFSRLYIKQCLFTSMWRSIHLHSTYHQLNSIYDRFGKVLNPFPFFFFLSIYPTMSPWILLWFTISSNGIVLRLSIALKTNKRLDIVSGDIVTFYSVTISTGNAVSTFTHDISVLSL